MIIPFFCIAGKVDFLKEQKKRQTIKCSLRKSAYKKINHSLDRKYIVLYHTNPVNTDGLQFNAVTVNSQINVHKLKIQNKHSNPN